ncbi:MAG: META domain-containing protein, partial [Bacteroides sp.]|nr:META domain-containing protein [Bacteroides sp.]
MRKVLVCLCVLGVATLVVSCMTSRRVTTPVSVLQGEWDITEINGIAVTSGNSGEMPYIGFDTNEGRVYGNSGCNRIISTFNLNANPGVLDMSAMAGTRMACPDMTTEQNILNTLTNVRGYRVMSYSGNKAASIALTNAEDRPIAILKPKTAAAVSTLGGSWNIVTVRGKSVSSSMETKPFIEFNVADKRIHGNAGCNVINGGYNQDGGQSNSLRFTQVVSTMMACPELDLERQVLDALNEVTYYEFFPSGMLGLYNNGILLLE